MTIEKVQNEIITECSALADRVAMYDYLIAWGERLETLDDRYRSDDHSVIGCQSSTWVHVDHRDDIIHCTADSDSAITRGMLALVLRVINGHDPRDILNTELFFIDRIGLRSNLSPARSQGLTAVLNLIQDRISGCVTDRQC